MCSTEWQGCEYNRTEESRISQKLLGPCWEKISMHKMEIIPIGRTTEILFGLFGCLFFFPWKPKSMGILKKLVFFWPKMYRFLTPQKRLWMDYHCAKQHQNKPHFLCIVQLGRTGGVLISQRTVCPCSYFWAFCQGKSYLKDFIILLSSLPNTAAVDLFL